jgi:GAF domain-containing protein
VKCHRSQPEGEVMTTVTETTSSRAPIGPGRAAERIEILSDQPPRARLASLTGQVATVISYAESRAGLTRLAEEQMALRRVATLVARGTAQEEVFAAVVDEVVRLLPADLAIMGRYESDGTVTSVARWGGPGDHLPVGSRRTLGGDNLGTIVFQTGRAARIDRYPDRASGPLGLDAREGGIRSSVATPIMVEGRLWGVIAAGSTLDQALPADTEARLASFTELVATAIANAESRAGLARLVDEQAALQRVATLVARGMRQDELCAVVTEEVGRLLPAEYAYLGRYEPDGALVVAGAWDGGAGWHRAIGSRLDFGGKNLVTTVFETGRSARMDNYGDASGPLGVGARERGTHSAVGTPIMVEGRVWGVAVAGLRSEQPLPVDAEARLGSFTELVATAIANAESRAGLARLGEEQAALRRIATLVARGVPPEQVFAAVTEEVERLLPVDFAHLERYEPDDTFTVLAAAGSTTGHFSPGTRPSLGGRNLATIVFETDRPARIDNYADHSSGPLGTIAREAGIRSGVGTPIMVEGHLWGLIAVGSMVKPSLPGDIEVRLSSFTELVATAIANAESRAALTASRVRIVAAADESRRRIERDLHDGAQQRLVHAVIVLKLALQALSDDDAGASDLVAEALRHAQQAHADLRELAHGILPEALTRGGLQEGVEALVSRVSLPVSVDVPVERLPASVEATAYFVISEALTNVVKHAHAAGASVTARVECGELRVEIRDDGVGGADSGHGTGLGGLDDRVSALDGRLALHSPAGGGTRVRALLPVSDER